MENQEYIEVGTTLYKIAERPLMNGKTQKTLIPWSWNRLKREKGENIDVPSYDGFVYIPNHINHQEAILNHYNRYEKITHEIKEGKFVHIKSLMKHIFGEQYEFGLDYIQLLYLAPEKKLPILLLVSEERNTGKTTFLNFLKIIFQDNATFSTCENLRSKFNADWGGKLLVLINEVHLDRPEDSERLKNLSTALKYKLEAKGKDRVEVDFFAKFILCSNNENNPIYIAAEETRYWVRKIGHLLYDDTCFLQKLENETPAFLYHLLHRKLKTKKESRMWFNPKRLKTKALENIIMNNRNTTEIVLANFFKEIMDRLNIDSFSFCIMDLVLLLHAHKIFKKDYEVRQIIHRWKLEPAPNALTYYTYHFNSSIGNDQYIKKKSVGRFYTITTEIINTILLN